MHIQITQIQQQLQNCKFLLATYKIEACISSIFNCLDRRVLLQKFKVFEVLIAHNTADIALNEHNHYILDKQLSNLLEILNKVNLKYIFIAFWRIKQHKTKPNGQEQTKLAISRKLSVRNKRRMLRNVMNREEKQVIRNKSVQLDQKICRVKQKISSIILLYDNFVRGFNLRQKQ